MKYYIADIKVFDIEKMKQLSTCIKKENDYILIFSLSGIFKIDKYNNEIQQILYKDKSVNPIEIKNYNILEDLSETIYSDVSQIPLEHFSKKIREEVYMMREKAFLKFVILKNNDEIIDFYFESEEQINNPLIVEDLASFLSFRK